MNIIGIDCAAQDKNTCSCRHYGGIVTDASHGKRENTAGNQSGHQDWRSISG
jgi:hypothetical protein